MGQRVRGLRYLPKTNTKIDTSLVIKNEKLNLLLKKLSSSKVDSAKIKVTLVRSTIGRKPNQIKTVKALKSLPIQLLAPPDIQNNGDQILIKRRRRKTRIYKYKWSC